MSLDDNKNRNTEKILYCLCLYQQQQSCVDRNTGGTYRWKIAAKIRRGVKVQHQMYTNGDTQRWQEWLY